jgi:peptidyl-prolyl cis-trans isomerase SurA
MRAEILFPNHAFLAAQNSLTFARLLIKKTRLTLDMKTIKKLLFTALVFVALSVSAQDKNAVVLTVDNEPTTVEEFENIFKKNNRDSAVTPQSLDEYMELFINFKLKVKEAKEMGLDTVGKFKQELAGYRAQLARPYLTDSDKLTDLVKEAYERQQQEVHAMHILVKCEPVAASPDTLAAYNRAMALRARIIAGEDFATVAKEKDGSDDPSAKDNGGDLGYFTVFQMVHPFEDAAYNTPIGQVSMPVRTRYGYHIIKVLDKRTARGEVHVAHIMVKPKTEANGEANAATRANEIYQKIKSGEETFENLAAKYSDDLGTGKKGGELPWFGTNKMVAEFENASFGLAKDGDVSEPIKTSFGYHIIKRLGYKPVAPFADVEKDLKNRVSKDGRSEKTRKSFIEKIKKEYNYTEYNAVLIPLIAKADTNIYEGKVKLKKRALKKTMLTIGDKKYTVKDYIAYLKMRGKTKTHLTPAEYVKTMARTYGEDMLMDYENARLEQKHPAFRLLMKEYKEGILLFELTDQKVWSKAVKDTTGLKEYYEKNKSKFMWPERADVIIYTCGSDSVAAVLRQMLAQGRDRSSIAGELNKNSQLNLQIEEDVYARDERDLLAKVDWKKGMSQNLYENGLVYVVEVKEILPPSEKKLDEAKGLITSDYQTYLEQEWIKQLRSKHKVVVNKEVLHSIR